MSPGHYASMVAVGYSPVAGCGVPSLRPTGTGRGHGIVVRGQGCSVTPVSFSQGSYSMRENK